MLTAATTNVSPLSWWQALAAAGGVALASLVAGVIVILGRRTFVGSARPPRTSSAGPQRGIVGRRAAAQSAQAAVGVAQAAAQSAQSAQAAQAAAGVAQAAAQSAQAAQAAVGVAQAAQAAQPDPPAAQVPQAAQPQADAAPAQTDQPRVDPAADKAAQPEAAPAADQASPAVAQGGPPPAASASAQAAQPPVTPADQSTPQTDGDFIRSWIAITLVIALVFFCAFAFSLNDSSLQSTLIGGLIASVGTAVAFYFSSKASDKARQDIINAAGAGNELVPSLTGKTKADAAQMLGQMSFSLIEDPNAPSKSSAAVIKSQYPPANTSAIRGSSIVVTFG